VAGIASPTLATDTFELADRVTHRDFNASTLNAYCDWTWDAAGLCMSVIHRHQPPLGIGDTPTNPNDPIIAGVNLGHDNIGNPLWREDLQTTTHSEHY